MDTIEVKVRPPAKKPAVGGDSKPRRRGKRQAATTPTRLTRAMLKKLKENGGAPVELDPGLEMAPRRRSRGSKSPREVTPDQSIANDLKAKPTVQESGPELGPSEKEKLVSESDVAAASRLAQAAIAAGLTRKEIAESPHTTGHQRATGLVHLTKDDLSGIFKEVVNELGIQYVQDVESHWLARTEFLTWWQRPVANIDPIKEDVRRLVFRWGKDLKMQIGDNVEIPVSVLESWRADDAFAGGHDLVTEVMREEPRSPESDVGGAAIRAIKESFRLAKRDLADWKDFFDGAMSPERPFRSKRVWGARLSELQAEAAMLQEKIRKLDVYNLDTVGSSSRQAADSLLRDVQDWRDQLQKDQDAFQDEVDREEQAHPIEKAENDHRAEEDVQLGTQPEEEIQKTEVEKEGTQTTEVEEDHESNTEDIVMSGVEPAPAEQASEETGHDDDSRLRVDQSAHTSDGEASQERVSPVRSDESMLPTPTHLNDVGSDHGLAGLRGNDADQLFTSGDSSAPSEEERNAEANDSEGVISERVESAAEYKESVRDEEAPETEGESQGQDEDPEASPEATLVATPERNPEANPEATPKEVPEALTERILEATPGRIQEVTLEGIPETFPEVFPERVLEEVTRAMPARLKEATLEVTPEREPEVTPERVSGANPERSPEPIPEAIPESTPEATPWLPSTVSCYDPAWEWPGREHEDTENPAPPAAGAADEAEGPSLETKPDTSSAMSSIRPGSSAGVEGEMGTTADHTQPPPHKAGSPQDNHVGSSPDVPQAVSPRESPGLVSAWRFHKPQWEDLSSPLGRGSNANDYSANEVDDDEEVYDYLEEEEEEDDFDL